MASACLGKPQVPSGGWGSGSKRNNLAKEMFKAGKGVSASSCEGHASRRVDEATTQAASRTQVHAARSLSLPHFPWVERESSLTKKETTGWSPSEAEISGFAESGRRGERGKEGGEGGCGSRRQVDTSCGAALLPRLSSPSLLPLILRPSGVHLAFPFSLQDFATSEASASPHSSRGTPCEESERR